MAKKPFVMKPAVSGRTWGIRKFPFERSKAALEGVRYLCVECLEPMPRRATLCAECRKKARKRA